MKKIKLIVLAIMLCFGTITLFAQAKEDPNPWSLLPLNVQKVVIIGNFEVEIFSAKISYYDMGHALKDHKITGNEIYAENFVKNGILIIDEDLIKKLGKIRLHFAQQFKELELYEGANVVMGNHFKMVSLDLKIQKDGRFTSKHNFVIDDFMIKNCGGKINLTNATIKKMNVNITPDSENVIIGHIFNEAIYVNTDFIKSPYKKSNPDQE